MSDEEIRTRWSEVSDGPGGATAYQRRFDDLAASGVDVHGEATFVASLLDPPARILDAGCGTGRVAIQLGTLGYHCVGVDADGSMVEVAAEFDPGTEWARQDISTLELPGRTFDLGLMAGNVVPLLAADTLDQALVRLAAHVRSGGLVVAGFGLDAAHLPPGCPVTPLIDYDSAATAAGLTLLARYSAWDQEPWRADSGYAVSVHQRT